MDGERILKLSGQGSVYIRCLEPLEEEDRDEEDEQLMTPAYAQHTDDITGNPAETSSSSLQKQESESVSTDLGVPLLLEDPMPFFPEMWDSQSIDNNYEAVINVNHVFSPTAPSNGGETAPSNGGEIASSSDGEIVPSNDGETAQSNDGEVPTKVIRVHRLHVKADMLEIFSDPSIIKFSLSAIIINQLGHEEAGQGIGVLREVFSLFWKDFYESHMLGETERVPYIRHDFDRNKWEAVARILVKGYTESQYFPHKISKTFLAVCLFREESITWEMLQDSFKRYVSHSETKLIEGCLANTIACDSDEMLDFFSAFDCKRKVTPSNVAEIMREVAHKEIVQKPQYVSDCWQPILAHFKIYFPDVSLLYQFYSSIIPTNLKVIALLKASPATAAETEAMAHLKRFIRGLDEAKLTTFLRFTTAADVIVTDALTISFTNSEGLQRRPIAHTCGCTLEVPSTYASFCELREEFMAILNSDSWEMNIL